MKVSDLIELLSNLDPNSRVIVRNKTEPVIWAEGEVTWFQELAVIGDEDELGYSVSWWEETKLFKDLLEGETNENG
jgi:hypothetical protein